MFRCPSSRGNITADSVRQWLIRKTRREFSQWNVDQVSNVLPIEGGRVYPSALSDLRSELSVA